MAVLVTRPYPDNETTATALRAKGFDVVLAPMLRFEPVAFADDGNAHYAGVIVTSANALRAIEHPGMVLAKNHLADLPLFAGGEHTADVARAVGFRDVRVSPSGAAGLPDLIEAYFHDKRSGPLLYLAGADLARDTARELSARGFEVVTKTVYRMIPIARLPGEVRAAFAANGVEVIMHYSQRTAQAFVAAARADGVEISSLALPQCCISDAVALVLRDAGAAHVVVARGMDEKSMLDTVDRVLRSKTL